MSYQKKEVTSGEEMKLDAQAVEECLNVHNSGPVVLHLTDSEIVHMVMHPKEGVDTGDEIDEGTVKKNTLKLTNALV
jgi:hypothetical protein